MDGTHQTFGNSRTDLDFERRWWRFERVIYWIQTALVVLAIAGLFGRGPLSAAHAASADRSVRVDYERLARFRTPTTLTVHVVGGTPSDSVVDVTIDGSIVGMEGVSHVTPEPRHVDASSTALRFTVARTSANDSVTIRIALEPGRVGMADARLTVGRGPAISLSQLIYP
jgi:hypothetical protein